MSKAAFEKDLANQIAKLSTEKQPSRDLWSGVELALSSEQNAGPNESVGVKSHKTYLFAATIAMFGVLGWLSLNQPITSLTGDDLVLALSHQHQLQKEALLVRFKSQPALTQNWQEQIAELDEAAKAIKMALKNEPNNMALLKMLQNVYQQQINLIERVHSPKWLQI